MTVRVVLRPWRLAQSFLLIVGLLAVGYTTIHIAALYLYQKYEVREFDQAVALRRTEPVVKAAVVRSLMGKIEIPRLKISAMVREGVDDRTLDVAAGHIPHTAMPGETGNVGVAAHRDTLFRNLKDVRRGDNITMTTLEGHYTYRVVSFQVVKPSDVSVLDPTADEKALTLVTCYPFYFVGNAPKRFIVHALQVGVDSEVGN